MATAKRGPVLSPFGQPVIGPTEQAAISAAALELAAIIRHDLPVFGETLAESQSKTSNLWYDPAVDTYARIEAIRNPERIPHAYAAIPRGCDGVSVTGTIHTWHAVDELLQAVDAVCEHYGWEGISDKSARPRSPVHGGAEIPPIPADLLDRLESRANGCVNSMTREDISPEVNPERNAGLKLKRQTKVSVNVRTWGITIDGKREQLDSELQARWLKVLVKHRGKLISGPELAQYDSELQNPRTDRLLKALPPSVKGLLEVVPKKGTRMLLT